MVNGEEITLKLTTARVFECENHLGCGIPQVIGKDQLSSLIEIVASAISDGTYPERKNKAFEIFDDMIDNGNLFINFQMLAFEILVNAGFMAGETLTRLKTIEAAITTKMSELSTLSEKPSTNSSPSPSEQE